MMRRGEEYRKLDVDGAFKKCAAMTLFTSFLKKIRIQENGVLGNRENQVFVHDQISAAAAAFDNGQIFVQIIIES